MLSANVSLHSIHIVLIRAVCAHCRHMKPRPKSTPVRRKEIRAQQIRELGIAYVLLLLLPYSSGGQLSIWDMLQYYLYFTQGQTEG